MRELDAKSRRDLFRGSLDVMVLAVLADGRQYGYSIQKRLRAASGQAVQAGTLYPLLHRLETHGLIAATWEEGTGRPRKWYSLTSAGEKKFRGAVADWQAMFARMQSLVLPALRHVTNHPQARPTT
ncbi:MAG: helix-turn-helix transcriptional regulator [Planctomycetota bacterium]